MLYHFSDYRFDTQQLALFCRDTQLALRPKTAVLIALLIENHQRLLSKKEIISSVWQSEHVQDQSLFQAIFEIRKTLAPLEPIKTHPNLGYQWVLPLQRPRIKPSRKWRWAIAASMTLGIAGSHLQSGMSTLPAAPLSNHIQTPTTSFSSPALQAFSIGMEYLNKQQPLEAEHFFNLAKQENPLFLEAALMKAEALLSQGQFVQARQEAQSVLVHTFAANETYLEISVTQLLSRISEQEGQLKSALQWAVEAHSKARTNGFSCTAQNTQQRLQTLLASQRQEQNNLIPNAPDTINAIESSRIKAGQSLVESEPNKAPVYCEEIRLPAIEPIRDSDLSQCQGTESGLRRYAQHQFSTELSVV